MALSYFIPTVWSETLYRELDREYIAVKNCSRDFEGDIKNVGDTVKIVGVSPVSVFNYTKNTDMSAPEELTDSVRTLQINVAKAFNFAIDDIDKAQATPKLMKEAMHVAASALANEADKYVYGLYSGVAADQTMTVTGLSTSDVINALLEVKQKMLENDVAGNEEIILEVPPAVASKIVKARILNGTDNTEALDKGCIGTFMGFKVYVSNNIRSSNVSENGETLKYYKCFARTKRAITFAEQLNEIEAYRPELRFADAVKGLHLYGAKIVYPKELLLLNVNVAASDD
ncbi:MAG: hypothetical protein II135_04900 [Clostridia bacterium]|nr:hypothetical protein [Clostridia bacterium]